MNKNRITKLKKPKKPKLGFLGFLKPNSTALVTPTPWVTPRQQTKVKVKSKARLRFPIVNKYVGLTVV